MAAESLLRELEEKNQRDLAKLQSEFAEKEQQIKKRTQDELSEISESSKRIAADTSQRERVRVDGAGKLQAKKLIFDATEKMFENNLTALKQVFGDYTNSGEYNDLLLRMVKYSTRRLGDGIGVKCRQADADALKKDGVKIISSDLNSIGGFKAESQDGTLELDLTFEELLRFHQDNIRSVIQGNTEKARVDS